MTPHGGKWYGTFTEWACDDCDGMWRGDGFVEAAPPRKTSVRHELDHFDELFRAEFGETRPHPKGME